METDHQIEKMDVERLSSLWPEDVGTEEADKQFNVEISEKQTLADCIRLPELMNSTHQGSSQLTYLVKQWEYRQNNAVRLLRQELKNLREVEAKELKIIEEHNFERDEPENVQVVDETSDLFQKFRQEKQDELVDRQMTEIDEQIEEPKEPENIQEDKNEVENKVDDEENSETVVTPDMKEAENVEETKEEEEGVKEEESQSSVVEEGTTETKAQVESITRGRNKEGSDPREDGISISVQRCNTK